MTNRERVLYRAAIAVLVASGLFLGWRWQMESVAATTKASAEEHLKAEVARLQAELDKGKAWPFLALSDVDIGEMKVQGLNDPVADLIADLQTRAALIPFQPIAGGQTQVGAWLINRDWVLAAVGDGHKGIWAMLHYEITNGRIKWTVLATGT